MKDKDSAFAQQRRLRLPVALFSILVCLVGIWFTARVGYARLMVRYASLTGSLVVSAKAVGMTPLDAQAHSVRAAILYNARLLPEAAEELERAVSLRPRDDYLWLQLGMIRDELKQTDALLAFDESVRLAPYYAHPQWQRGNFLLRSGRYDEAFVDMRSAAASNQNLVPSLIDLAWGVSKENSALTEQWAGITDDVMRIAFARFLARQGKAQAALEQFRSTKVVSNQARRELMQEMIAANAFREAYEIWRGMERADNGPLSSIHDGDFEDVIGFDDTGFGWRFSQASQGARLSLDPNQPEAGSKSLLVSFLGYSDPAVVLLSQLLLVEPSKRYRVKFSARTKDIVTGGLPLVGVNDAGGKGKLLGQSAAIGFETPAWQTMSFDFQTDSATEAVELRLHRKQCNSASCPIFGSLWLDNFLIEELK